MSIPRTVLLALGLLACVSSTHAVNDRIVTASERGTYIEIGRDISRLVAKPAGIALDVLPSKGSAENVRRLRSEPNVRLALVQSDVYRAFLDQARAGDAEAARLITPLRVVMPLFDEEIYFVTRADSPLQSVNQIRGKRINVGTAGSGTALTVTTLYHTMFGTELPEQNTTYLSNEEALVKLATEKSIDVVVIVAGQPAKLLADMKPEAKQYIKILPVDLQTEESKLVSEVYTSTTIRSGNYPNLLTSDLPALGVKSMLVTYDYQSPGLRETLTRLAQSMCQNFEKLKTDGHSKWKEINLAVPALPKGWTYYPPTHQVLSSCASSPRTSAASVPSAAPNRAPESASCPQSRETLGLCRSAAH